MKNLNEDLKTGQFKQIYLLYGEEGYLKRQYRDRFIKAMLPEGDTMNYAHYEGKNINVREVIDLAETLPFFAERRLIVFEDTGFFKSAGAELADYIKDMPDTTYFIFVENEVDKRSRLYKAVKAKGIYRGTLDPGRGNAEALDSGDCPPGKEADPGLGDPVFPE